MTQFNNNQSSLPTTTTNTINTDIGTNIEFNTINTETSNSNNSNNIDIINTLPETLISDTSSTSFISLNDNTNTTSTTNTTNTSATNIPTTTTMGTSAKKENYNDNSSKFYKRVFFQQFFQNNKSSSSKKINKTRLMLLSESSNEYKTLKEKFQHDRPLKNSNIHCIVKLEMPSKLVRSHERYKKIIARLNNLSVDEVTRSVFHGTFTNYNPICNPNRFFSDINKKIDELKKDEKQGEKEIDEAIKEDANENTVRVEDENDEKIIIELENGEGEKEIDDKEDDEEVEEIVDYELCENDCGMCGIIREGNKTKCSKHKSLFSKRKMWFATDPNTSLYFCTNGGGINLLKTMFVVDVISKKPKHIYITNKEKETLPRYLILFEQNYQNI